MNTDLAKAFEEVGTSDAPAPVEETSAEAKIEVLAKALRVTNPELSEAQAYAKALTTDEGMALYGQHLNTPKNPN